MPFVNVKVAKKEEMTPEQKEKIISGITELLYEVLGKKPESTYVLIEEWSTDDWGVGGLSITKRMEIASQQK